MNGIDTKTDDFVLQPGTLVDLKNMWMNRTGKLEPRYGFDSTGGTESTALAVADWYGDPLRFNERSAQITTTSGFKATAAGFLAGRIETYDVGGEIDNIGAARDFSYAESADYGVMCKLTRDYTASGNPPVAEVQFVDLESRKVFYYYRFVATRAAVVTTDTGVALVRKSGTTIYVDHFVGFTGAGVPDIVISNATFISGVTVNNFDVAYLGNNYIGMVYTTTDTRFGTFRVDTSAAASAQISALVATHVSICKESAGVAIAFCWYDINYSCAFTPCTAPNTIGTTTTVVNYGGLSYSPSNITCHSKVTPGATYREFCLDWDYNAPAAGTYTSSFAGPNRLEHRTFTDTTLTSTESIFGARIASRSFEYQGRPHIFASSEEITIDQTNNIMCLVALNYSADYRRQNDIFFSSRSSKSFTDAIMSEVIVDDDEILVALPYSGNARSQCRLVKRTIDDVRPTFQYWNGVLLHNVTPHLSWFDGRESRPVGFPGWPIIKAITTGAGSLTGTYGYTAIWEKVDVFGNVWRSAPAVVKSVALSSNQVLISFWVPPFFDTVLDEYKLIIYRTTANGGIYYELRSTDAYDTNGFFTITDNASDASISSNPLLYTDGGILENVAPPAAKAFCVSKDRVFVVSSEDNNLFASKARVNGEGVNFNDAFQISVNGPRGLECVGAMDEKVLAFGDTYTYLVYGSGPDELGNGQFEQQLIADDIGCIEPRSIMLGDAGLYFLSKKGLWLYGRDMASNPIGIPVDLYKSETIVGNANPPDRLLHLWYCASGTILVWDEYHKMWSRFVTSALKSGCVVDGKLVALISSGAVYRENSSSYLDASVGYACEINTGWMSLAGIQGFQKIRKISVLGESQASDFNLTTSLRYDFIDIDVDTYVVSNATVKTTGYAYQWEIKPDVQKCESIKLKMSFTTSSFGAAIVGLAVEAGQLPGVAARKQLAKRVGSS